MTLLSIVTRTYRRPEALACCQASVACQTDSDYQHVIIEDEVGVGVNGAARLLVANSHEATGDYVFMLDDDDMLAGNDFIAKLRAIIEEHKPPVIMVKMKIGHRVVPDPQFWRRAPRHTQITTSSLIVRNDLFQKHIHNFAVPPAGDDYHFGVAVWVDCGRDWYWWNHIAAVTQNGRSWGRAEE